MKEKYIDDMYEEMIEDIRYIKLFTHNFKEDSGLRSLTYPLFYYIINVEYERWVICIKIEYFYLVKIF